MKTGYDHNSLEENWQKVWEQQQLFQNTTQPKKPTTAKLDNHVNKRYLLFAFAYPSGSGLHVGHVESKTALDILARYHRMQGDRVFFPVGWDAFGLPAENYAVKTGVHPAVTTKNAINTFRRQIKRLGISYDWANEIATNHPDYYKWTQWIFLQLYHKKLAYKKPGLVNWCPSCQTVLANEQVVDGECERCGTQVVQKELEQWYFAITKYQDELIDGLQQVDWPKPTQEQQLHWIGKKTGINIHYRIEGLDQEVVCFTTRPDTNFGATFIVLAPEHGIVEQILKQVSDNKLKQSIIDYVEKSKAKTELERQQEGKKKTGVFTGFYAINNLNSRKIPVYISDFVLASFGTGAVVGVPGHDRRDFEFAKVFNIDVIQVVAHKNLETWKSYLMGGEAITDTDLSNLGIIIKETTAFGSRKLELPKTSLEQYKQMVRDKLSPGFWNEVVGEEIWFCFKDKKGKVREFIYSQANQAEIGALCSEFSGDPIQQTQNLYAYLASNDWYGDLMIQEDDGQMINSEFLNGLDVLEAKNKIMDYLEEKKFGQRVTTYRLRDWLISRQRYWGAPIPIVYDPEGNPHPVKEEHLPWLLPTDVEFKPTGESPLTHSKEFQDRVEKLYGKGWRPEYDTMDTFVDSSWYFLRYVDSRNSSEFASKQNLQQLLPVDFYMIGPEHIVLHLLYSRFLTKFLRDEGYLCNVKSQKSNIKYSQHTSKINLDDHSTHLGDGVWCVSEPFMKMRHQGMILGPDHKKMSKSKGNVIDPDQVIANYGADTLRMYEMFMGPIEADKPWSTTSVVGVYRFLTRVHNLVKSELEANKNSKSQIGNPDQILNIKTQNSKLERKLHQIIKKVSEDIPALKFNTAIASMMEFVNIWESEIKTQNSKLKSEDFFAFVKLLAPFAPFLAEELFQKLQVTSNKTQAFSSIHLQNWPKWDPQLIVETTIAVVVQVNGKVRGNLDVQSQMSNSKAEIFALAKQEPNVNKWIEGKQIRKEIFVPGSNGRPIMVNFVVA